MSAISLLSDSYAFTIAVSEAGVPNGVAAVEQNFVKGLTNEFVGMFDGGKSHSVGASHTTAEVVKQWLGATVRNMVAGDTQIRLNAWKV